MSPARQLTVGVLVFFVALFAGTAIADPVEWPIASGGNGHLYEAILTDPVTWDDTQTAAEAAGGYLATITSPEENAFVFSLVDGNEYWNEPTRSEDFDEQMGDGLADPQPKKTVHLFDGECALEPS